MVIAARAGVDLGAVLDELGDAVVVANAEMSVVLANRAADRLFRVGAGGLVGRTVTELIPERFRAAHVAGFDRFVRAGERRLIDGPPVRMAALASDGTEVDVELTLRGIGTPGQPDLLVVACLRDGRQQVAFDELRYRAALLSAQIESAPYAILAVSPQRRVLACNRRFEQLWNIAEGSVEVGGESPALMQATLSQVTDPEAFERAIRWGHEHPTETQHLEVPTVDGRVIEGTAVPIIDDQGTYRGRIWFLTDDTERRAVEAERARLVEDLQAAQRSQAFLLEASRVLAGASGYVDTLQRLAGVAVPILGDLCLIDVVDDEGRIRRIAARYADPSRQALADELERSYPPDPEGRHPTVEVIRTARSQWSAEMTDEYLRATSRDEHHYELVKQLGFTSYITVPLIAETAVVGTITVVSAGSGRRFGPGDLALAEDLATQVAQVVVNARRYEQEHRTAHTLQASLLPRELPYVPGVKVAVRYLASTEGVDVGGDWFDLLPLDSGSALMAVGDVAGHDIGAAAAMGQVRSAGRALVGHASGPATLLRLLQASWDQLGIERMATCVMAQINPGTGELAIASAGHPPPLVVAGNDAWFLPVLPGAPLGAPAIPIEEWRGVLERGSVLLLYTDGLVEDRLTSVDRGMARLAAAAAGAGDPDTLCNNVLAALAPHRSDDVAVLALLRT